MVRNLIHKGKLIHESTLEGETRSHGLFPGHINGLQASKNRFLLLYTTRGWRGSDDNVSVICQIRDGAYDGPLIREICLAKSINDWMPFDDGKHYVKAHLHPLLFGVPKGAVINGAVPQHAGLFVFMWHREIRELDPQTGFMLHYKESIQKLLDVSVTEWVQVRLNDSEDDLDIIQPKQTLRQKNHHLGYPFCELETRRMVLTMNPPVPFNSTGTEWIGSSSYEDIARTSRVATLRMSFNPQTGLYEWTDCGPLSIAGMFESAVISADQGAILMSRIKASMDAPKGGRVAWFKLNDPFGAIAEPAYPEQPITAAPVTAFRCADGVIRLLSNEPNLTPYPHERNPLYMWDIDPEAGFRASNCRTVFDSVAAKIPIRDVSLPVVDQAKVLPHVGGNRQLVAHRVRPKSLNSPFKTGVIINDDEREASGIYYAEIEYDRDYPAAWSFE